MADVKTAAVALPTDSPPSYEVVASKSPPAAAATTSGLGLGSGTGAQRPLVRPPPLDLPVLRGLRKKRVILASASPRRKQLLAQIGLTNVEIIPSRFEENLPKTLAPFEYVLATATQKALAVYRVEINNEKAGEPGIIIAADTVVVNAQGEILEKPRSEAQHIQMLQSLRDSGLHRVYTAVVCMVPLASARDPGYALESATEETMVKFDPEISDELLWSYVRTREGADKAGGYGIQGTGAILVERIEGSFDNVVGLPLRTTLKVIERVIAKADDDHTLIDEDALNDEEIADIDEKNAPDENWLSLRAMR